MFSLTFLHQITLTMILPANIHHSCQATFGRCKHIYWVDEDFPFLFAGIRDEALSMLHDLQQGRLGSAYGEDGNRDLERERTESVEEISRLCEEKMKKFVQKISEECKEALGPPPCNFSIVTFHPPENDSLLPFGPLNFALLTSEGQTSKINQTYLNRLYYLFCLKILNLKETPLHLIPLESFNMLCIEYPNFWFYDTVTSPGLSLGQASWLERENAPNGNFQNHVNGGSHENGVNSCSPELILSPKDFAKFLISINSPHQAHNQPVESSFMVTCADGDISLVEDYTKFLLGILLCPIQNGVGPKSSVRCKQTLGQAQGLFLMKNSLNDGKSNFVSAEENFEEKLLRLKHEVCMMVPKIVYAIGLYHGQLVDNFSDMLTTLQSRGVLSKDNMMNLRIVLSISRELGMLSGLKKVEQGYSKVTSRSNMEVKDIVCDALCLPVQEILCRFFETVIPLEGAVQTFLDINQNYGQSDVKSKDKKSSPSIPTSGQKINVFFKPLYEEGARLEILTDLKIFNYGKAQTALKLYLGKTGTKFDPELVETFFEIQYNLEQYTECLSILENYLQQIQQKPFLSEIQRSRKKSRTKLYMGHCHLKLENNDKAVLQFKECVRLVKRVHGAEMMHYDTAEALAGLGYAQIQTDDLIEALSNLERSVAMLVSLQELDNVSESATLAKLYNYIGFALKRMGKHRDAGKIYELALMLTRQFFGMEGVQPQMSAMLNNLANALMEMDEKQIALLIYAQMLQNDHFLKEGEDDIHISVGLHNVGCALEKLGNKMAALECYQRALVMSRNLQAGNSMHVAETLNNLGSLYHEFGRYEESKKHLEESLVIYQTLDKRHIGVVVVYNNLATVEVSLNLPDRALQYSKKAMEICTNAYGAKPYDNTAATYSNLGQAHCKLGDYKKAKTYSQRALRMWEELHGKNAAHLGIATALANLGQVHVKTEELDTALDYHQRAYEMRQNIREPDGIHPDIADSLIGLGTVCMGLKDYANTYKYCEEALQIHRTLFGEEAKNDQILNALLQMAIAAEARQEFDKSTMLCEEALVMCKSLSPEVNAVYSDLLTYLEGMIVDTSTASSTGASSAGASSAGSTPSTRPSSIIMPDSPDKETP